MRRGEKESIKFICDPRIGHTALSLEMCRTDQSLTPELTLDLTHHILKSNIYRNTFYTNIFFSPPFFHHPTQSLYLTRGLLKLNVLRHENINILKFVEKVSMFEK